LVCAAAPDFPNFDAADSAELGVDPLRTNMPEASATIAVSIRRFILNSPEDCFFQF
jgi:hypothetical protein